MSKIYLALYLLLFFLGSCNQKNKEDNNKMIQNTEQQTIDSLSIQNKNVSQSGQKDAAEEWLHGRYTSVLTP